MFLGYSDSPPGSFAIDEVDARQLETLRSSHRLIDVRHPAELTGPLGHIPGAENVPLEQLAQAARQWPRNEPLVLVCHSGHRSAHATLMLQRLGFTQVLNLRGGMLAYNAEQMRQAA